MILLVRVEQEVLGHCRSFKDCLPLLGLLLLFGLQR